VIIYYSGTPGIEGGLPEDLLDFPTTVMTSMIEYGGDRAADRRLERMKNVCLLRGSPSK